MPDLVDQSEDDALTLLEDAGLEAGSRTEAFSDAIAAGNVVSSAPAASAEVEPGSAVSYVVSLGVEPVPVPDIVDLPEDEALAALDEAGLAAGERSEAFSDTIATGNVVASTPPPVPR